MKVKNLIEELQKYGSEEEAFISVKGKHIPIEIISFCFWSGVDESGGCSPLISDGKKRELTRLGGLCRKLRLENDIFLKFEADYLGVSSAELCSIEYGEKPLTGSLANEIQYFMLTHCNLTEEQHRELFYTSRDQVKGIIEPYVRTAEEEKAMNDLREGLNFIKGEK